MHLIIKGGVDDAQKAAEAHGVSIRGEWLNGRGEVVAVCERHFSRAVLDWFLEDVDNGQQPLEPGSLLFYREHDA